MYFCQHRTGVHITIDAQSTHIKYLYIREPPACEHCIHIRESHSESAKFSPTAPAAFHAAAIAGVDPMGTQKPTIRST